MLVYVLNKHGKPLMPCRSRKAKVLLQENRAKIVDVEPFIIQLIHGSSGYKQPVNLGVDAGYEKVGMSAISGKRELYCSKVELRTDISKLLTERRAFRRARRNRKTRYRKPRFLNRASTTRNGKLMPSVQHKLDTHIKLIDGVKKILPVTRIVVEKAKFDIALINNPELEGKDYLQGPKYGYKNMKCYIRDRDGYKCRNCGDNKKKLEVHHIIPRKEGGSDRPDNLITLCEECHEGYHKDKVIFELKKAPVQKQMSIMNVLSKRLAKLYESTFGYLTKMRRLEQGLEKSHTNDAFIIAGGSIDTERLGCVLVQNQVRRNNRKLFRGKRSEISNKCVKEVFGFRLFDRVVYENKKYFVCGRRRSGIFLLRDLAGNMTERTYKKLKKISSKTSFICEFRFPSAI